MSYTRKILIANPPEHIDFIMLKDKLIKDKTMIYVCENNVCYAAAENIDEAVQQLSVSFKKS